MKITFKINGRKVHPNKVGDALEAATIESIKKQIIAKVVSIRDPQTGERPRIKIKGRDLRNLSFEVSGSEELIQRVKERLR